MPADIGKFLEPDSRNYYIADAKYFVDQSRNVSSTDNMPIQYTAVSRDNLQVEFQNQNLAEPINHLSAQSPIYMQEELKTARLTLSHCNNLTPFNEPTPRRLQDEMYSAEEQSMKQKWEMMQKNQLKLVAKKSNNKARHPNSKLLVNLTKNGERLPVNNRPQTKNKSNAVHTSYHTQSQPQNAYLGTSPKSTSRPSVRSDP